MRVSVSDIGTWKRCRRKWDLTSYNRKALVPKGLEAKHFYVGTAMHKALEAQAQGGQPRTALEEYWAEVERKGQTSDEDWNMVVDVLHHYFDHYGWDNPVAPLRYAATELSFNVRIPRTLDPEAGEVGELIGTFDGIVTDGKGSVWILDHKTYQRDPDLTAQQYNEQFIAYEWAFLQLFGQLPKGVIYDGIRKKAPKRPALLKNGALSRDLRGVSYHTYMAAIKEHGLREDDYAEELGRLSLSLRQEQNDFFTRWFIRADPHLLDTFERQLAVVYDDMTNAAPERCYPTFSYDGCFDCPVRTICHAMQQQGNAEYIIETSFTASDGYATTKAQGEEPIDLDALRESLFPSQRLRNTESAQKREEVAR